MRLFHLFSKRNKKTVSDTAESIIGRYGFPHRVFAKGTDYKLLIESYRDAAARGKTAGFTPVFVIADETLNENFALMEEDGYSAAKILTAGADAQKGKQFLLGRFEDAIGFDSEDADSIREILFGEYGGKPKRMTGLSTLMDLSGRTAEAVLFEIPTEKPWEIAAYIPFGGWNECPAPADMFHVLKYWYDRYGAVPAVISRDTLEMTVPAPVREADALELAKEHYAFDPDRVDQGTESGSLAELAASLRISDTWFFWWD